jgi:hypothetical protein
MQTFLPYADFSESAKVLDTKRLGKQRVECLQILNALRSDRPAGWTNHPATRMWRGYEDALIDYAQTICKEWFNRGYEDSVFDKLEALRSGKPMVLPPWLGNQKLHLSHQSNLLRKDPVHYGKFGWTVDHLFPYWWPV